MFFGKLIDLGISDSLPFYDKRETRIVNLFAIITLSGLFVGITTLLFISGTYPALIVSTTSLACLLVLILNARRRNNAATYLFVVQLNLTIFCISQQYVVAVGNYLYYFPLIFCVALLHNPFRKNIRTIIFFSIILLSFILSITLDIQSLKLPGITEADTRVLLTYNCVLTVSLTIILVYLVVRLINQQNNELLHSLDKEKASQILIGNSLREKEVLLAEVHHRVKNNLAVISGLLNLQLHNAVGEEAHSLLLDARNRVMSLALAHERLYKKQDLSRINLGLYLQELTDEVIGSHKPDKAICVEKRIVDVEIPITKAVPTGLIINEVITNSLKHAFRDKADKAIISLDMQIDRGRLHIRLSDNGPGFGSLEARKESSLGISLIESLAEQIDASLSFSSRSGAFVELSYLVE